MAEAGKIKIDLGSRSYWVHVRPGLMARTGPFLAEMFNTRRAIIITDSTVGALYTRPLQDSLRTAGLNVHAIAFPAGEEHKNLATYNVVMERLLGLNPPIDRRTMIVSLGGGVVGDLAGFVAATALRGVDFISLPTTLLAAVDASVGGKTGLDAQAGKNLVGAFHQPRLVLIDTTLLTTLPAAQLRNGLAECVKHAVVRDATLLNFIAEKAPAILAAQPGPLAELILRNVAIKAAIVSADEHEKSLRALLNFGHTLGHALETAAGYGGLSHGQAVSMGMVAACHIAAARGLMHATHAAKVRSVLESLKLPVRFADLPALAAKARDFQALLPIMGRDKKAARGTVRWILPKGLGDAALFEDVKLEEVRKAIEYLNLS
jgi:3-dehydroquinate synthase